jgi:hypothetical protein
MRQAGQRAAGGGAAASEGGAPDRGASRQPARESGAERGQGGAVVQGAAPAPTGLGVAQLGVHWHDLLTEPPGGARGGRQRVAAGRKCVLGGAGHTKLGGHILRGQPCGAVGGRAVGVWVGGGGARSGRVAACFASQAGTRRRHRRACPRPFPRPRRLSRLVLLSPLLSSRCAGPSPMGSMQSIACWLPSTRGLTPPSQAIGFSVMLSTPPAMPIS